MEDAKDVYDDLSEIDTAVSSALYLVSSLVHKTLGTSPPAPPVETGRASLPPPARANPAGA